MSIMNTVACTDQYFVLPTGVMMYSVCKNIPGTEIVLEQYRY